MYEITMTFAFYSGKVVGNQKQNINKEYLLKN